MPFTRLAMALLLVAALLIGCGQSEQNSPTSSFVGQNPGAPQDPTEDLLNPVTAGTGLKYTLVPNEDLTDWSYTCKWHMDPWQMGPNCTAMDEVTDWNGNTPLDSLSVSPWPSCRYAPDSWGFSNIGSAHPGAVIASIDVNLWLHAPFLGQWESLAMHVTLFLDGNEVSTEHVYVYDPVMTKVTARFVNLGGLAKINTMEVELRAFSAPSDFWVHAMNANVFAYVPGKNPPIPYQEP